MRQKNAPAEKRLGIYIHIPFCKSKCDYCDFYSLAGCGEQQMQDYLDAISVHMAETAPQTASCWVDSVYFGGGTPTVFGERRLLELLKLVKKQFRLTADCEITVEANPDSVDKKMLTKLRRAGVNRLSLGAQSGDDGELKRVGRPHSAGETEMAVQAAWRAGFENLNLDLIYGLPGQTMESWRDTLDWAISLEPDHLSCYGLKIEESTPLWAERESESIADGDTQAEMYLLMVERLRQAGYEQYEISNFARPGYESRHNLKYWRLEEYIGFGPGAHSDFGGRRYSFCRDLEGYIRGVQTGGELLDEDMLIPRRERGSEYLMLGLRTVEGVSPQKYRRSFGMSFAPLEKMLEEFAVHGWAEQNEECWRLTPEGMLVSNQLIGRLLEAQEQMSFQKVLSAKS